MAGWFFPQQRVSLTDVGVDRRSSGVSTKVSPKRAMQVSAVWAATRLRADLESTLPIDVFKRTPGSKLLRPMDTPPVLVTPDVWADEGHPMDITEWMAASRLDLDRYGNCFGIITARDGQNLPREIHLVAADDVTIEGKGSRIKRYRIGDKDYDPRDVWHERQYVEAGSPLGMSPIALAARPMAAHLAAMEFILNWFDRGVSPSVILKNTAKVLDSTEASRIKRRVAASLQDGAPAVVGKDWDISMSAARAKDAAFLEVMDADVIDIARYFGVPADLIDAAVSGQSITYANISQRNLQFLIMNFGPAVTRREKALSRLVPGDRFVKLNTEALLRMEPTERRRLLIDEKNAGVKSVDEVRELENFPPLAVEADSSDEAERAQAVARLLQMGYLAVGKAISAEELRALANRLGADLPIPGPDFTPDPLPEPGSTEGAA